MRKQFGEAALYGAAGITAFELFTMFTVGTMSPGLLVLDFALVAAGKLLKGNSPSPSPAAT